MPSYVPPKINTEYITYISLPDQANTKLFKANPTIAAGDFKVSTDGGALGNLATLPTVTPAAGKMVKITLSTSEMNGDNVTLVCSDAAGAEWADVLMNIQTSANLIDSLSLASVCTEARLAALTDWLDGGRLDLLLDAIPTTAMRGTDNAALASVCTEARLAALTDWLDGGRLDLLLDAVKAKTDNLPDGVQKATNLDNFMFLMVDSTDDITPKTGLTVTGEVSIDGGAWQALTNSASEIGGAGNGKGWYKINLDGANDLNGDTIGLRFDGGATAHVRNIFFKTVT